MSYLPQNQVIDNLIDVYIVNALISSNPHLAPYFYYHLNLKVNSVEVVEDDLLVANVEFFLMDDDGNPVCDPVTCDVDIENYFPLADFFNMGDGGMLDHDEFDDSDYRGF
uniref:Uncharacterized protein n=1 Tax=Serratia phage Kevin TaxID=3161161 RepID=A0AAU8KYZ4_9CAUD